MNMSLNEKEQEQIAEADKIREILAILPESEKAILWGMINGFKVAHESKQTA